MKLALIPPKCFIDDIFRTDYQLVVPGTNNLDSYRQARKRGDFIILDNGAPEGASLSNHELMNLAQDLMPNEIVIPDTIADLEATLNQLEAFEAEVVANDWSREFGFMGVLQGTNMQEVERCLDMYLTKPWITALGVPRHFIDTLGEPEARLGITVTVRQVTHLPIHLLGTNYSYIRELHRLAPAFKIHNVRGVDTSAPYNYANAGKFIDHWDRINRPGGYFDLPQHQFSIPAVRHNIETVQGWTT